MKQTDHVKKGRHKIIAISIWTPNLCRFHLWSFCSHTFPLLVNTELKFLKVALKFVCFILNKFKNGEKSETLEMHRNMDCLKYSKQIYFESFIIFFIACNLLFFLDTTLLFEICLWGSLNKFNFFVWAVLLIVHTWNSSPLRSNLLRLQCTLLYHSNNFWKSSCVSVSMTFITVSFISSIVS